MANARYFELVAQRALTLVALTCESKSYVVGNAGGFRLMSFEIITHNCSLANLFMLNLNLHGKKATTRKLFSCLQKCISLFLVLKF